MQTTPTITHSTPTKNRTALLANRSLLTLMLLPGVISAVITIGKVTLGSGLSLFLGGLLTLAGLSLITKNSPRTLGSAFREKGISWRIVFGGLLLGLIANEGILFFFGAFAPQFLSTVPQLTASSLLDGIFLYVAVGLLVPFYEEFCFRYLALDSYSRARSPIFAVVFTSILFALVHGSVAHSLAVLPIGLILALIMIKTRQFWTVVVIHALNNILSLVAANFGMYEATNNPVLGGVGLLATLVASWLAVKWLGLPQKQEPTKRDKLWSASLVIVVVLAMLAIFSTTYAVLFPQ